MNGTTMPYVIDDKAEGGGNSEGSIVLPFIFTPGLFGNLVSLVTILHSRLRYVNANVYLIALTLSDSAFLMGIALIWLKLDYVSYEYCVAIEYLLMTSSYISSWTTTALTIERFLAVVHPLRTVRYGHVSRARMMWYWMPIPFILQLFQFVSLVPVDGIDERKCQLKEAKYQIFAQAVDTVLCYVIPCAIILVFNLLVLLKIHRSTFGCEDIAAQQAGNSRRQGGSSGEWTRILWVMPMVYIVFNTPFYVCMMLEVYMQMASGSEPEAMVRSDLYVLIYNTAHYMYYLSPAIDVLVYAFSSANFRKTAVIAWSRILCPRYAEKKLGSKVVVTEQTRYSYRMPEYERRTGGSPCKSPNGGISPNRRVSNISRSSSSNSSAHAPLMMQTKLRLSDTDHVTAI